MENLQILRQPAATEIRPDTSVPMAMRKPWPSSPSRLFAGTARSRISNIAVFDVGMPSFAVRSSLSNPGPRSTTKALTRPPGCYWPSGPAG